MDLRLVRIIDMRPHQRVAIELLRYAPQRITGMDDVDLSR